MFTSIKNTKKGFTLIELLVVIAIIGILSSVVLASLSTARQKSRDAKRISDVGQIQLALELFFDASQSYPSTTPGAFTGQALPQLLAAVRFLGQEPPAELVEGDVASFWQWAMANWQPEKIP